MFRKITNRDIHKAFNNTKNFFMVLIEEQNHF